MGSNGEKFYATGRRKCAIAKVWFQISGHLVCVDLKSPVVPCIEVSVQEHS